MEDEPDVPASESAAECRQPTATFGDGSPRSGVVHPAAWSTPACGHPGPRAPGGPTSHDQRQATLAWVEELCVGGVDGPANTVLLERLEDTRQPVASVGATDWAIFPLAILVVAPALPGDAPAARQDALNRLLPQARSRATELDDEARDALVRIAELA